MSETATKELAKILEDIGVKRAKEEFVHAVLAGRKTIKTKDIEIAIRKIIGK